MSAFNFGPDEQSKLLELSFEPHGEGYLFYRHRWASGVPVTSAERESYLAVPVLGSRAAFYDAIRGRAAVAPPRKFKPVYWRILSRMPVSFGVITVLVGLAIGSKYFSPAPFFTRALLFVVGIGFVAFGAQLVFSRIIANRRTDRDSSR